MSSAERAAEVLKLFIPIITAGICMFIGALTAQLGWIAAGAGLLGIPFMIPTTGTK